MKAAFLRVFHEKLVSKDGLRKNEFLGQIGLQSPKYCDISTDIPIVCKLEDLRSQEIKEPV